ncbi:hypothetical protein QYF36_009488 [Acer negundo]|nr:hypothetical protein QYF36_009488 [Acer negundo]
MTRHRRQIEEANDDDELEIVCEIEEVDEEVKIQKCDDNGDGSQCPDPIFVGARIVQTFSEISDIILHLQWTRLTLHPLLRILQTFSKIEDIILHLQWTQMTLHPLFRIVQTFNGIADIILHLQWTRLTIHPYLRNLQTFSGIDDNILHLQWT